MSALQVDTVTHTPLMQTPLPPQSVVVTQVIVDPASLDVFPGGGLKPAEPSRQPASASAATASTSP